VQLILTKQLATGKSNLPHSSASLQSMPKRRDLFFSLYYKAANHVPVIQPSGVWLKRVPLLLWLLQTKCMLAILLD